MYTPEHFRETRPEVLHQFMREHPLGALVDSTLNASHVPMLLDTDERTLRCHMARANEQWRTIETSPNVLVIFSGPEHYISPSLYEHHPSVPTWNYIAVHAYGHARLFEGDALYPHLQQLTSAHDESWRLEDAPREYIDKLIKAIVGIEISIDRLEGKWKMSQNRPAADRDRVAAAIPSLFVSDREGSM